MNTESYHQKLRSAAVATLLMAAVALLFSAPATDAPIAAELVPIDWLPNIYDIAVDQSDIGSFVLATWVGFIALVPTIVLCWCEPR